MAEDAGRFGYERVIAGILHMIKTQGLVENSKLPTLPELQDQFDTSSTTARRAIDELKRQGVVESRQGSGLFVIDPAKAAEVEAKKDQELRTAVDALRQELHTLGSRLAHVEERLEQLQPPPAAPEGAKRQRSSRRAEQEDRPAPSRTTP
jgi:DNA-binding GntR family transcriptional regulator